MQKFIVAAIAAAFVSPVFALATDREQPIEVHADQFNGDEVKQTAVYSGNVSVDQGSMNLLGARSSCESRPRVTARQPSRSPARFKQQRDPNPKTPNIDEWCTHRQAASL